MVYVKKLHKKSGVYYSLVHSLRQDGKIIKKQRGLGTAIPTDLEDIKAEFFRDIYQELWFDKLDDIQENFFEDVRNQSHAALQKAQRSFNIRFNYNSNKIEGNMLNHRDTQILLEEKIAPNKPIHDIEEIIAHDKVFDDMLKYEGDLGQSIVLRWHRDLLLSTKPEDAGIFRKGHVSIGGSSVIPPSGEEVEGLIVDFFTWVNRSMSQLIDEKVHPVEFAALVHQKFVTIHPFYDGNGRMSRILQNFVLNRYNFPMLIIESSTKKSYYNALERSNIKEDPYIFVQWFIRNYLKANKRFQKILTH